MSTEKESAEPSNVVTDSDNLSDTFVKEAIEDVFKTNLPESEVLEEVQYIIENHELEHYREILTRGALLANDPTSIEYGKFSEDEKTVVKKEISSPIASLSIPMILSVLASALGAINFGMDESAVGGALVQYQVQFNITDTNVQGFVVAAPYLTAAILGAPLTLILNKYFGRRYIIMFACFIGFSGSLWQAFSNGLAALLVARLYLGVGMGLTSSVIPVYIAEVAPANARGILLILWQTFVALGVCLGSVFNRAFVQIDGSLSWRLMIGSSCVAPLLCGILIYFPPESPRWLITNNRVRDALITSIRLRPSDLTGSRDFFILFQSLKYENELAQDLSLSQQFTKLFTVRRNRFALWVSFLGVFTQQYGGVNILVNYTTTILTGSGVSYVTSIAGSIGVGGGCFLATFFASRLIDNVGRRKMLLFTIPVNGLCLFWLGGTLHIPSGTGSLVSGLLSIYIFVIFYGAGIGPVSFALVAETASINVRIAHSSFIMAVNWLLDFCLSMSWPKMSESMTASGGLYFYGAWNFIATALVFFYIPETKRYTLEQLDEVFKQGASAFAQKQIKRVLKFWNKA